MINRVNYAYYIHSILSKQHTMHIITTDILEYVVAPLLPYFNSIAIRRILSSGRPAGDHHIPYDNTGLELMNILSAGKLLYAVGHYADQAVSQLFMTAFTVEISILFWLTAQVKEWGDTVKRPAKIPVYMAYVYLVTLLILLLHAT